MPGAVAQWSTAGPRQRRTGWPDSRAPGVRDARRLRPGTGSAAPAGLESGATCVALARDAHFHPFVVDCDVRGLGDIAMCVEFVM